MVWGGFFVFFVGFFFVFFGVFLTVFYLKIAGKIVLTILKGITFLLFFFPLEQENNFEAFSKVWNIN